MANLLRVRTVVQQTLAKQDAERTNQFLHAASSGDVAKIRQVGLIPLKEACFLQDNAWDCPNISWPHNFDSRGFQGRMLSSVTRTLQAARLDNACLQICCLGLMTYKLPIPGYVP